MTAPATDTNQAERKSVIGITSIWIAARILGYHGTPNEFMPAGTEGVMHVCEIGRDGSVIYANFYPRGVMGYGAVINPIWEHLLSNDLIVNAIKAAGR